jgi:hypothetical protein
MLSVRNPSGSFLLLNLTAAFVTLVAIASTRALRLSQVAGAFSRGSLPCHWLAIEIIAVSPFSTAPDREWEF